MLTRRDFLKLSAAGAGAAVWPQAPARGSGAPKRPNILIFLTDDHGQWAQPAYGNTEILAPNLERLASNGTWMANAVTTCPVCSPARASFFTGRMPSQHGIHDWISPKYDYTHPALQGQTLISQLLKAAGYRTGLVGKWHCGRNREPQPGFDRWFSHYVDQYPHDGIQHFSDQGNLVIERGQQSPLLTDRAIDFIRPTSQPFFLYVSYVDTHSPHNAAPTELVRPYRSCTFRDIPSERFAFCHGINTEPVNTNAAIEREKHAQYYGAVSSIDREVGRILAALEANGQLDDTLVTYTGDHGLNCGHHGMWEKGEATFPQNFLEESIRIACILSWPKGGIRRGAVCRDFVNHCDLWATILEVAGAAPSAETLAAIHSPGRSYLATLTGGAGAVPRETICGEYGNARFIRTKRHKLILRYAYAGRKCFDELYDLQEDPRETVNRFTDPALAATRRDLANELEAFFREYSRPGHDGLHLDGAPLATDQSPWLPSYEEATLRRLARIETDAHAGGDSLLR